MKIIVVFLAVLLIITPVFGQTLEAQPKNHLQELDITFWQTLPFATLWCYALDSGLSSIMSLSGAPHWDVILVFATLVSAGNAMLHSQKVMENERAGDN